MGYGPGGGYGPGVMGGYGRGMMGGGYGGGLAALNLSDEQQEKIFAIQEDHRRKNFDTMSKVRSETFKLRRMYSADGVDAKSIVEQPSTRASRSKACLLPSNASSSASSVPGG